MQSMTIHHENFRTATSTVFKVDCVKLVFSNIIRYSSILLKFSDKFVRGSKRIKSQQRPFGFAFDDKHGRHAITCTVNAKKNKNKDKHGKGNVYSTHPPTHPSRAPRRHPTKYFPRTFGFNMCALTNDNFSDFLKTRCENRYSQPSNYAFLALKSLQTDLIFSRSHSTCVLLNSCYRLGPNLR
jgi:hypothetical protein